MRARDLHYAKPMMEFRNNAGDLHGSLHTGYVRYEHLRVLIRPASDFRYGDDLAVIVRGELVPHRRKEAYTQPYVLLQTVELNAFVQWRVDYLN